MQPFLRRVLAAVALVLIFGSVPTTATGETAIPAAPTAWVTDTSALLTPQTVSIENARLRDYERKTGHQILVYIAPTTGGVPIEDWSVSAFKQWKVGRKGLDDGLVLFIFSKDRTLRIEVGYGLEAKVPDVLASRIIRNTITPALSAGKPDQGVTEGLDKILQLTGDGTASNTQPAGDEDTSTPPLSPLEIVLIVLALIGFGILAIRSPWLALFLLVNIFGGRGGGMSGEGGFSGGGGRSGGGGASGRW